MSDGLMHNGELALASGNTIYEALLETVARHTDRPFLRVPAASARAYAAGAIEFSYGETLDAAAALAGALAAAGVSSGDRVAIAHDSRVDVYLYLLAVNALGASLVPLNMGGSDAEIGYVIEHSDSKLVTGADDHIERLQRIVNSINGANIVSAGHLADGEAVTSPCGQLQTEAAMLYTSGTTGQPKGCMLSNEYFLTMGREYNRLGGLCAIDETDRLATPLPPNHMNALSTSFMAMLMCGGCVIQLDRFHPRDWWQTVREEGASVIHYLGVMPAILLMLDPHDDDFSRQVKFGFGAGSDPKHQQVFEERFGFPLIEAWAMTESGGGGMTVANDEPRHIGQRCIGRPIDTMEYRLVDKHDNDVAPGSDGELVVRAKGDDPRRGFFSGYYKDEAATEEGWKGGWWHTGDVVREGPDGSLFFVDRRKNVIRRSGENIAAVEVEAALLAHPAVANCAVTAVPDEMRGDEVFAFIVTGSPASAGEELARKVFDATMDALTYFKVPGYIRFVDELPLTASQKINRATVRQQARECVESGLGIDLRTGKKRRPAS